MQQVKSDWTCRLRDKFGFVRYTRNTCHIILLSSVYLGLPHLHMSDNLFRLLLLIHNSHRPSLFHSFTPGLKSTNFHKILFTIHTHRLSSILKSVFADLDSYRIFYAMVFVFRSFRYFPTWFCARAIH